MRRRTRTQKQTVEQMSVAGLSASDLLRRGAFREGEANVVRAPVRCVGVNYLRVWRFRIDVWFFGSVSPLPVRVSWSDCYLGGERPWLHCRCGRRVGKLLRDGDKFCCRRCAGSPLYACQSVSTGGRKHYAAAKLRLQLGGSASLRDPLPEKPERMRAATFKRQRAKLEEMEAGITKRVKRRTPDYPNLVVALGI